MLVGIIIKSWSVGSKERGAVVTLLNEQHSMAYEVTIILSAEGSLMVSTKSSAFARPCMGTLGKPGKYPLLGTAVWAEPHPDGHR